MKKILLFIAVLCLSLAVLVACDNNDTPKDTEETTSMNEESTSVDVTTEDTTDTGDETTDTTEETTTAVIEGLDVSASDLSDMMKDLFSGTEVKNETLFFIDKGDEKRLLYPATEIISVTSYDGKTVYTEGKDYTLTADGKLKVTENSSIPCITGKEYYKAPASGDMIHVNHNGVDTSVYWGEGTTMTKWQVCVSYKHESNWEGFAQESNAKTYEDVIKKLIDGKDVTFIFYGDSITCGANSSWYVGTEPYQYSYPMLFTTAVADLFDYTVDFVDVSGLHPIIKKTPEPYVAGTRGTIHYINPSVGGWTTNNGLENFDKFVKPYIEQYGCDLFTVAFGMNDGGTPTNSVSNGIKSMINKVKALSSDAHYMIVSTMVPNPSATNGWYGSQKDQEQMLNIAVASLTKSGLKCAVAKMTSMSKSVLEYKEFLDYTGNNINHPNDFFGRVYAQTLLQTFIGYENLK